MKREREREKGRYRVDRTPASQGIHGSCRHSIKSVDDTPSRFLKIHQSLSAASSGFVM